LKLWQLDSAQSGWITGAFYLPYVFAVPILVSLTGRIDPKRIHLLGVTRTTLAHLGFATVADGFWSAFALRTLAGIG
jgi:MFS family permease